MMFIYGTQRLQKSFRLPLAMYVSLSKPIQFSSSRIHISNEGASILFQHRAIALLAWTSPKSRSLVVFNVHANSCGYIPSTQNLALNGKLALNMSDRHLTTSFQKIWILEHSHRQWIRVLFSFEHFVHISGISGDIWWFFSCHIHSHLPFVLKFVKFCVNGLFLSFKTSVIPFYLIYVLLNIYFPSISFLHCSHQPANYSI